MHALNLLRHPSLSRRQKILHRCWSGFAGLLLGAVLAWGWVHWQNLQTPPLRQEQALLQQRWDQQVQSNKEQASRQAQARLFKQRLSHLANIAQHQHTWDALHATLHAQTQRNDWQLERLWAEAEALEMHGTVARMGVMAKARQDLSDQLNRPLFLVSMTSGPSERERFVWQTAWPAPPGALPAQKPSAVEAKP